MQIQHYCLQPANFKLDGGAMFGIIPKPLWMKSAPADELNRIDLALRVWCVKIGPRLIVVDTGIGDYHHPKFAQQFAIQGPMDPLGECLKAIGFSNQEVTDLVLSHLHFDHAGGIGREVDGQMRATFPNANLHLHKQHYAYSKHPTERDAGSFLAQYYEPVLQEYAEKGKVHWMEGEEGLVLKEGDYEMRFRCSHGHTPFLAHPYDDQYIYLADLIPTSNHMHVPWVMGYDISPGKTTQEKRALLTWVREKKLKVIFEHDPKYWGASIELDERGAFRPQHKFQASEGLAQSL